MQRVRASEAHRCDRTDAALLPAADASNQKAMRSGHDHDEGHSSDGATATAPAVLVAALAALAYA